MKTAALLLKYILGLKSYVAAENTHKMSIEEDNPSICPDCGFCADNGGALAQHSQHWHGEIQRCPHCRFTSNQVKVRVLSDYFYYAKSHVITLLSIVPCQLLMSHALKIHRDDEPFACQYKDARYKCDYEAKAKNVLNKHVKICHLKEKPFQCQYCQYR